MSEISPRFRINPPRSRPVQWFRTWTAISIVLSGNANWLLFALLDNADMRPVSLSCLVLLIPGLVMLLVAGWPRNRADGHEGGRRCWPVLDVLLYAIAVGVWLIPCIPLWVYWSTALQIH